MSKLNLQCYISGDQVQTEIGDGDTVLPIPDVWNWAGNIQGLSPEQLTVWAAQLRMVAQQLDDMAQEMQPQICFPTTGMEGE